MSGVILAGSKAEHGNLCAEGRMGRLSVAT